MVIGYLIAGIKILELEAEREAIAERLDCTEAPNAIGASVMSKHSAIASLSASVINPKQAIRYPTVAACKQEQPQVHILEMCSLGLLLLVCCFIISRDCHSLIMQMRLLIPASTEYGCACVYKQHVPFITAWNSLLRLMDIESLQGKLLPCYCLVILCRSCLDCLTLDSVAFDFVALDSVALWLTSKNLSPCRLPVMSCWMKRSTAILWTTSLKR